jgi:phage-related protein
LADLPTSDPGREVPLEAVGASLEDLRGMREQMAVSWSLPGALYLLDVFQKKSSTGIRTPRRDLDRILARWRRARDHHGIHYGDG